VWDICTPPLLSPSRVGSLERLRGYTYKRIKPGNVGMVEQGDDDESDDDDGGDGY
jgi:hypothetical protein